MKIKKSIWKRKLMLEFPWMHEWFLENQFLGAISLSFWMMTKILRNVERRVIGEENKKKSTGNEMATP